MIYQRRDDIKIAVKKAGKTLVDLSCELDMNYDCLQHCLSGRRRVREKLDEKIKSILAKWMDE